MEFVWFLKKQLFKIPKSDTHLPPVNRTQEIYITIEWWWKKKCMFDCFTEPFSWLLKIPLHLK